MVVYHTTPPPYHHHTTSLSLFPRCFVVQRSAVVGKSGVMVCDWILPDFPQLDSGVMVCGLTGDRRHGLTPKMRRKSPFISSSSSSSIFASHHDWGGLAKMSVSVLCNGGAWHRHLFPLRSPHTSFYWSHLLRSSFFKSYSFQLTSYIVLWITFASGFRNRF